MRRSADEGLGLEDGSHKLAVFSADGAQIQLLEALEDILGGLLAARAR